VIGGLVLNLTSEGEKSMANWRRTSFLMAVLFLTAWVLTPNTIWAEDHVPAKTGAFLAYCKTNNQGCVDEVADISFAMQVTNPAKKEWCPTKEVEDVKLLTGKVVEWLTAHPETADMATEDGIEMALVRLYPCNG